MILQEGFFNKEIVGWSRKWIDIRLINSGIADNIIKRNHYAGKATTNRFKSFGVYKKNEKELMGVIQLGHGIRPHIKQTWGENVSHKNSVEFDRMWLSDDLPKFSETIVLSCLRRYLKHVHPEIKYILSYADGSVGNVGIIYQAGNYEFVGESKADFYILSSGERVHPVSMWHRHKTRAWDFLQRKYPGIKKAEGKQYRYILEIK